MKKYLLSMFIFSFVVAFSSAYEIFAQETHDFEGTIQVKVGKKKIKEDVAVTVDVPMTEEGGSIKRETPNRVMMFQVMVVPLRVQPLPLSLEQMTQNVAIPWTRIL